MRRVIGLGCLVVALLAATACRGGGSAAQPRPAASPSPTPATSGPAMTTVVPTPPSGAPPQLVAPRVTATDQPLRVGKLTIRAPRSWRVLAGAYPGPGGYLVATGDCVKPAASGCPGFLVLGSQQIETGNQQQRFDADRPYQPARGVQPCPLNPSLNERLPDTPKVNDYRSVGGRRAIYRTWTIACVDDKDKVRAYVFQHVWYLPDSQVLIVDESGTPDLDALLSGATWS